jgi:hypothetical protein
MAVVDKAAKAVKAGYHMLKAYAKSRMGDQKAAAEELNKAKDSLKDDDKKDPKDSGASAVRKGIESLGADKK